MIEKYKNYYIYNGLTIPISESNSDYLNIKEMIANGVKVIDKTLDEAKEAKLAEINSFHDSKDVKYLTIKVGNLQTGIFVNQEYRYLIDEQRELLQIRKDAGEANPTWLYQNGITLPLDLKTLNQIRLYIGKLTDDNFRARANNIKSISNFKTIEELEKFDIKTGYRINQILTF